MIMTNQYATFRVLFRSNSPLRVAGELLAQLYSQKQKLCKITKGPNRLYIRLTTPNLIPYEDDVNIPYYTECN